MRRPHAPLLSRRTLLAGAAFGLVAAACGGSSDDGDPDAVTTAQDTEGADAAEEPAAGAEDLAPILVAGFADGLRTPPALVAGMAQRAPVFLLDPEGFPLFSSAPDQLVFDLDGDGITVGGLVVPRHGDGVESAYYPIPFDAPEPTTVTARTELDGEQLAVEWRAGDRSEVPGVFVGDAMRPVDSPTFDDENGIAQLCTRQPEPCPFHDVTLTDALGEGRPVVLLISTPAWCQTAICGPVLELLIEASDQRNEIRFLHAEVYDDPATLGTAEVDTSAVVEAYELTFEPSLIVADAEGTITAKLDFTFDRNELLDALATV